MKTITMLSLAAAATFAVPALADDSTSTATTTPSAQQQCRTERTQIGKEAFGLLYGTNKNRSNAFGKCVSKRTAATEHHAAVAHANAAKDCDTEEAADEAAFKAKYGSGKNGNNAHGKCVSGKAKAKTAEATKQDVDNEIGAAKACKAERALDKDAFAKKYGTNANRRNAFGKCVSAQSKSA